MAASNAQITALEAALYSGELRVAFEGREVQYRSVDELKKALAAARDSQTTVSKTRRMIRLYAGDDRR